MPTKTPRARLDASRTAKPRTRLVTTVDPRKCIPFGALGAFATEYEAADGTRTPLAAAPAARSIVSSEPGDQLHPYSVACPCGHATIVRMRRSTAGVPFVEGETVNVGRSTDCPACQAAKGAR